MKVTMFLLLHIALCVGLFCWLITVASMLHFFLISKKPSIAGQQATAVSSLDAALRAVVQWDTAFALIDLIGHIFAWLYGLTSMGGSPLNSMFTFAAISFLGGVVGMVICLFSLLICKTSPECTALVNQARRLPFRLIVIGLASIVFLAILTS